MPEPEPTATPSGEQFLAMAASPEFQDLKRRLLRFVLPLTAFFMLWYGLYVLLSTFAVDFMATPVFGNINLGILIGLGQFVSTFVITGLYVRFANRVLDPRASKIRHQLEAEARGNR